MAASNENSPFRSGQSDRHRIRVQVVTVVAVVLVDSSLVGPWKTVVVVEGHHRRRLPLLHHSDCSTVATVFVVVANEIA